MSNYCLAADIQFLLGFSDTFSSSTIPTLTQINDVIATKTGELDFALNSVGITTQPTDTNLLLVLKAGCMNGVACWAGMSGFGNNDTVNDSQPSSYCKDFRDLIKDIKENPDKYGSVTGDETSFLTSDVIDGTNTEASISAGYIERDFEV